MWFRESISQNRRSAVIGGVLLLVIGTASAVYQMVTYNAIPPVIPAGPIDEDDGVALDSHRRADGTLRTADDDMFRDRETRFREHEDEVREEEMRELRRLRRQETDRENAATRVALP